MKYYRELIPFIVFFMLWIGGAIITAVGVDRGSVLLFIPGIVIAFAGIGAIFIKYDV
jgi:hypothetical protein